MVSVIRPNLAGRSIRHHTLLTGDAEMRPPVGIVPIDYIHIIEQDSTGGHDLTFSDEFLAPTPDISTLAGTINVLRVSVLGTNPVELIATLESTTTRSPILTWRDHVETTLVSSSSSNQMTFDISALDFVSGSLLVLLAFGHHYSTATPAGAITALAEGAMTGWTPIGTGAYFHPGSGAEHTRIRAMFKIADGTEGVLLPFVWGTNANVVKTAAYQVLALNVLGGTVTPGSGVHAAIDDTHNALATQTINAASYAAPSLAVSFAAADRGDATTPDAPNQSFSETADQDVAWNFGGSPANFVRARTKVRLFQNVSVALTSISNASPAVFTKTGHGLSAGDKIKLTTTGALPTGLAVGTAYYVIATGLTSSTFRVSTTAGGSAVNTSSAGSGTHSFIKQPADVTSALASAANGKRHGLISFPIYLA